MMKPLLSTYRVQFSKDFTFEQLEKVIPYLERLGLSTIYASPIFKAVPGSTHGYDGLDPQQINPELGTKEQLAAIRDRLVRGDMNWLQDIVPNHMAFDSGNVWLMDVLEKGPHSPYVLLFDTCWMDKHLCEATREERLMVPFLGTTLEEVIDSGQLKVEWNDDRFVFRCYESAYPIRWASYGTILNAKGSDRPESITAVGDRISRALEEEPSGGDKWKAIREDLAALFQDDSSSCYLQKVLEALNRDGEALGRLADEQFYRLCHWRETSERINYRRFFTINGLICLNVHDPKVFEWYHELTGSLLGDGIVQGLRIDHIDGLYDPSAYLQQLRELAGEEVPILVEKILEAGEGLPMEWPVQGTTGYDFLALVNNLFTNPESGPAFTKFYRRLTRDSRSIRVHAEEKKAAILYHQMAGELENLYQLFRGSDLLERRAFAAVRPEEIKEVIAEFLIHCPVYRYYGSRFPLEGGEADRVLGILNHVRYLNGDLYRAVDLLEFVLLHLPHEGDETLNEKIAHFYQRCMQFTGPLMAKGVEDTLMYTYHRFIGHNEVGDSPEAFGISCKQFHDAMVQRRKHWPLALNATSTHDTKRGEDVRARLNVLTDLEEEWFEAVHGWMSESGREKDEGDYVFPDRNDEYFIYQTLVGSYPLTESDAETYLPRIRDYVRKALREAKRHSNWEEPNETYEETAKRFAESVLDPAGPYLDRLKSLLAAITDHGMVNSLNQVILKFMCPGIPDVYQGCELWDLSLVDPDNRRPVDYETRMRWLDELQGEASPEALWDDRRSGKIKLWMTHVVATLRRERWEVFVKGDYVPLSVMGSYKQHVLAFARKYRKDVIIVVVPLHTAALAKEQDVGLREIDWKETSVHLPGGVAAEWKNVFTQSEIENRNCLFLKDLFAVWPFALVEGRRLTSERGAGILMHISSLPSAFGIGDIGPEARNFANFLHLSRQKYWQLLPLNPVEARQCYSPYSSISSRAGNELFISPELLARDGLLASEDLREVRVLGTSRVDYEKAVEKKSRLLERAWENYRQSNDHPFVNEFELFREKEREWLDDFAMYVLLKREHDGKPWYEWDREVKFHQEQALEALKRRHADALLEIEWRQFVFAKQWHELRSHCNESGIQLIGDLPIYVSYDSADVWGHCHLFALDEDGRMAGMAGVPPDAFSADGQLWGMPVFRWEVMKEEHYAWWIERLRKNIELFDIVRLDHFRAFSAYWEVPAGERTARNGEWKLGPGADFFNAVLSAFGKLPFLAEDLGEVDAPVYELRDSFHLAGMKVLQFAFGEDMPFSEHIPHNHGANFVVYTGTHDNNTTRGWFTTEADEETKQSIESYLGRSLTAGEVSEVFARMAYGSVASIAILPLQDVLDLDETARMNLPASLEGNWEWRLPPGQLTNREVEKLREWVTLYHRD